METPLIQKVCPKPSELSEIKKNIPCSEDGCNRMFLNSSNLDMHLLKHHKKSNKLLKINTDVQYQYHCPVDKCSYNVKSDRFFKNMKYLKQHFLKVHAEKSFCCDQCHKGFSTEAAVKKHERLCGIKFICSCNYAYDSYEALLTHAKRHKHSFDEKYKSFGKDTSSALVADDSNKSTTSLVQDCNNPPAAAISVPVHLLAAVALNEFSNKSFGSLSDKGVQTESKGDKRHRRGSTSVRTFERSFKRRTSTHTQTGQTSRAKHPKISTQTQTMGDYILQKAMHAADILDLNNEDFNIRKQSETESRKRRRKSMETQTTDLVSGLTSNDLTSESKYTSTIDPSINLSSLQNIPSTSYSHLNNSPNLYQLDLDVLPDLWLHSKNSSGTQTSPIALNSLIENDDMLSHTVTQTDINLTLFGSESCDPNTSLQNHDQQLEQFPNYFEDASDTSFNTNTIPVSFEQELVNAEIDQLQTLGNEPYPSSQLGNLLDNGKKDTLAGSKSCSTETQTEIDIGSFLPDCDSDTSFTLCSNIETQTTEEFSSFDHLIYSNMCTQTCDDILFSELGFADIETQTAWPQYSDNAALVSTETQTSLSACSTSQNSDRTWLIGNKNSLPDISHTETQTNINDFRRIIAELVKRAPNDIIL